MNKVSNIVRMSMLGVTAVVLQACSNIYPDIRYTPDDDKSQNNETVSSIAITPTLNYKTLFFASASRGAGAFDQVNSLQDFETHYLNSKFYILAYRRSTAVGELSRPADYSLLMNSEGNPGRIDCLVSAEGTQLQENANRGRATMPVDFVGALRFVDEKTGQDSPSVEWNAQNPTVGYDFFCYYIDDAVINRVDALTDKTVMQITLDGTQDLMVGNAPEVTDKLLKSNYPGVTEADTKEKVLTYGQGGYTTYGGSHSVQPKIDMKHCLTRLMVTCKQMDPYSKIKIKDINIYSKSSGEMTVAAANVRALGFVANGDYKLMKFPAVVSDLQYDKDVILGPGIMVPEGNSYDIEIVFEETYKVDATKEETKIVTHPITVKAPDSKGFQAGTNYYVQVTMYGTTELGVTVKMGSTWANGSGVEIDMQDQ